MLARPFLDELLMLLDRHVHRIERAIFSWNWRISCITGSLSSSNGGVSPTRMMTLCAAGRQPA